MDISTPAVRRESRNVPRWRQCFHREEDAPVISLPPRNLAFSSEVPTETLVQDLGTLLQTLSQRQLTPKSEQAVVAMREKFKEVQVPAQGESTSPAQQSMNNEVPAVSAEPSAQSKGGASEQVTPNNSTGTSVQVSVDADQPNSFTALNPRTSLGSYHQIQFMNELIMCLWPRIEGFVQAMVRDSIEPSVNDSLPHLLSMSGGVKFTKVNLGETTPILGPVSVDINKENGTIVLDMQVNMSFDLDVELTALHIPIGITKFFLKGDLAILLTPPMKHPPFFGGIQMYFLNPPDVDIGFSKAAKVADIPGLRGAIRSAIDSTIAGICVIPRRIAVDMNEDDDVDSVDLAYPEPTGILRFTLWSASDLVASDFGLFQTPSSDPYVKASLGIKSWTSPVIKKNLNPEWGDGAGITTDFLVHDDYQKLTIKVYDEDFGTSDDLIGVLDKSEVHDLIKDDDKPQCLELLKSNGESGGGKLTISASLLTLTNERPETPAPPGAAMAYMAVRLITIKGLDIGAAYPFKVHVQVMRAPDGTQSGKVVTKKSYKERIVGRVLRLGRAAPAEAGSAEHVLVEDCTLASHPQVQKQLSEAYQGIARVLFEKGTKAPEIAEILEVSNGEVKNFLKHVAEEGEQKELIKEQQAAELERLNVKHPRFDEVLQLLLPSEAVEEDCVVALTVLDKNGQALGTSKVRMGDLLGAPSNQTEGQFATDAEGIEVVGRLRLRWLQKHTGGFWTEGNGLPSNQTE